MTVKNAFLSNIRDKALGNSKTTLKHLACDLLNAMGVDQADVTDHAEGTFLCRTTIKRVMDCPDHYNPQAETIERIFRYCGAEITITPVAMKAQFANLPKSKAEQRKLRRAEEMASGGAPEAVENSHTVNEA